MASVEESPADVQRIHRLLGKRDTLYDLRQLISRSLATASSQRVTDQLEAILRVFDDPGWWWAALALEQRKQLVTEVLPRALEAEGRKARETMRVSQLCDDIGGVKHYVRGKHNDAFSNFLYRLRDVRTTLSIPPRELVELAPREQKLLEEVLKAQPDVAFDQALRVAVERAGEQAALDPRRAALEKHRRAAAQAGYGNDPFASLDDDDLPKWDEENTFLPSRSRSRSRSPMRPYSPPPPRGPEYSKYTLAHPVAGLTERQAARYGTHPVAWAARAARTAFL